MGQGGGFGDVSVPRLVVVVDVSPAQRREGLSVSRRVREDLRRGCFDGTTSELSLDDGETRRGLALADPPTGLIRECKTSQGLG